jgi:hypothetical protein
LFAGVDFGRGKTQKKRLDSPKHGGDAKIMGWRRTGGRGV